MTWPTRAAASAANFLDHFTGSSLDAAKWGSVTSGTGAVTVTDGYVQCDAPASSAAFVYYKTKIDKAKSQLWLVCANVESTGANYPFPIVEVCNSASAPVADTTANISTTERIQWQMANPTGGVASWFYYVNSVGSAQWWDTPSATWGGFGIAKVAVQPMRTSDYFVIGVEIDSVNSRWRLIQWGSSYGSGYTFDQGWRIFAMTDWVNWSSTQSGNDDLWLVLGRRYNDNGTARTFRYEWVRYCEQGTAGLIEAWTSAKSLTSEGHRLRHHWSYCGKIFVPQDRATDALTATGTGWEQKDLQCPNVIRDGSGTDYLFYYGQDNAGTTSGIGVATATAATPQNGAWSRAAGNPIISAGSGENRVRYPYVFKDNAEPDSNKRWKCVLAVERTSDGLETIHLATAPDPPHTSTWTRRGEIIPLGGGGTKDAAGCWGVACVVHVSNQYEVWYSGVDASGVVHLLRAYGPALDGTALTKDTTDYYVCPSLTQALTANLTGRTVTVASTTGFVADAMVILDQDSNFDNWSTSRIRKIVSSTQLELYHSLDGFTTAAGAKIRQIDATARFGGQHIWKVGGEWWFHMVQWGAFDDDASIRALCEQNMLYTHSGALPSSVNPTMDYLASPIISRGFNNDLRSVENIGLLTGPLELDPPTLHFIVSGLRFR